MNVFQRIGQFLKMVFSFLVEGAEDSVPLERRLAYDRQEKATKFKKLMDGATDVGQAAELMVQALAETRILASNLREEIKAHLQAAKAAASRGDVISEETEQATAISLANDLAEAEADLRQMEADANAALVDKKEALQMVLLQSRELERLAQKDARLVSKVRLTQMREQQLQLREAMLQLVPSDSDDIRGRALEQAKKREAKVKSRVEIVDALWQQKRRGAIAQATTVTARGNQILRQLQEEVGYQPAAAAISAPAEEVEAKRLEEGRKGQQ